MSIRRAALAALLLATLAAALAFALPALADSGTPTPLPEDQANVLATTDPAVSSGSSTSVVSGSAALSAGSAPGAATSIEAGITPQAAVGLTALSEGGVLSATRPVCWANMAWHKWGTWPYEQKIADTTYWCAVFGKHITYRTSTTTATGTLCGTSWRATALIGGGVGRGFGYFTTRSSAGFSCQTVVPWITIHTSHHEDVKRTDRGVTTHVGSG